MVERACRFQAAGWSAQLVQSVSEGTGMTPYEFPICTMLTAPESNRNARRVVSAGAENAEGQQDHRTPSRPSAQVSVAQTADAGDAHAMPDVPLAAQSASPDFYPPEIGRASCRERV